ncbi:MAG: cupin domain-containing protein [Reyranella sp.]|nr:cupin domain-containing protein [Reyranella sp.]MDP3159689.1 cupin domain-containing protein [Reyranella sp.]
MPDQAAPQAYHFADDGETPNNPALPLLVYRGAVARAAADPAAAFEEAFARHGWRRSWRNGIHDFLHFHTRTHEVLGIARGRARVEFGGGKGRELDVAAGDVVVLPAGTGHRCLSASADLLVVGAYPDNSGFDQKRPGQIDHASAVAAIAAVAVPREDPVYGSDGPLKKMWSQPTRD